VNHFAGGGAMKGISIDDDLNVTWQQIMDEKNETTWVYAEYDSSGETRRLSIFMQLSPPFTRMTSILTRIFLPNAFRIVLGKVVEVKAKGTGGLTDFKANLGDNLAWGGFKCTAVDNREVGARTKHLINALVKCFSGVVKTDSCLLWTFQQQNTTSRRSKFIFVQYMPAAGPAMRRAKMGSHKGTLKQVQPHFLIELCADLPRV